jgi:hypothetical protein
LSRLLESPLYFPALGLLCGVVGFRLGWRTGQRLLLPLVQSLPAALIFVAAWRVRGALAAALTVGGWAVGCTLSSLVAFVADPRRADRQVLWAEPYRASMLDWLRSGRGPESRPLATAAAHLRELALYLLAALVSANLLGIVMGAVLLNYMNAYVVRLLLAARRGWLVWLLAWNVWSVVRVAAYVALGSACAAPLMGWLGYPAHPGEIRGLLAWGLAGVAADLALKLALSRPWGRWLGGALDLDRVA